MRKLLPSILFCFMSVRVAHRNLPAANGVGRTGLQAVWKHSSIIPFERPESLGEKRAYSEEEALALERSEQQRFDADNEPLDPDRPAPEVAGHSRRSAITTCSGAMMRSSYRL